MQPWMKASPRLPLSEYPSITSASAAMLKLDPGTTTFCPTLTKFSFSAFPCTHAATHLPQCFCLAGDRSRSPRFGQEHRNRVIKQKIGSLGRSSNYRRMQHSEQREGKILISCHESKQTLKSVFDW